jgi:hypothetical protein
VRRLHDLESARSRRFRRGRYAGKTLGEVAATPEGQSYLLGMLRQPWAWGEFPAVAYATLVAAYKSLTGPMPPVVREP